ncbi:type II toxin-antitoxin system RelE/ParE family toxin [Pseudoclavibacter alba]|uniref:Type II toxin-antitoxin system RelE/ParE family toxin n=2 Tax=Pseudoclavibacter albus TaxID=272241 RepID=A0ABT2HYF6_9MICO|nr:type II toxin-antitoxin system RelE/ParE family toxin [Pseudoclavibacter alba]MCT2043347.1 type II toxin-antitoxin system RelE/ParE family toxin [Pseudoclavibacter alba]
MTGERGPYRVELTSRARKQLTKLDRFDAKILATWIKNNLDGCTDPRAFGKGLTANRSGEWRYRVGSYRILALIQDDVVTVEVFSIGRRDKVYSGFGRKLSTGPPRDLASARHELVAFEHRSYPGHRAGIASCQQLPQ